MSTHGNIEPARQTRHAANMIAVFMRNHDGVEHGRVDTPDARSDQSPDAHRSHNQRMTVLAPTAPSRALPSLPLPRLAKRKN